MPAEATRTKPRAEESKTLFSTGSIKPLPQAAGSASWLVVASETIVPATTLSSGITGLGGSDSVTSTASSFESIRLDSSTALPGKSHGEIDGMSFCRLGASLLKQSIEEDRFVISPKRPPREEYAKENIFATPECSESKGSAPSSPPFQQSEAYRQYQRSISSSESDSETELSQRERITDADNQLLQVTSLSSCYHAPHHKPSPQVKKESLMLSEKLRHCQLAIAKLQKNQTSIMPKMSKLENDVAVAIATAAVSSSEKHTSPFQTTIGSVFESAACRIHWLAQKLFSHDGRAKTATEMMQLPSCTLQDLEAATSTHRRRMRPARIAPSGYIQTALILTMFFGGVLMVTMCLVPSFELSQTWGWIPAFSHTGGHTASTDPLHTGANYREDPL